MISSRPAACSLNGRSVSSSHAVPVRCFKRELTKAGALLDSPRGRSVLSAREVRFPPIFPLWRYNGDAR